MMNKIEATLQMCTLFKGVPCGLALIKYTNPNHNSLSFTGMGVFNEQGELHNSSFTCIRGGGSGWLFSKMMNGRPADNSYVTLFRHAGH